MRLFSYLSPVILIDLLESSDEIVAPLLSWADPVPDPPFRRLRFDPMRNGDQL
jgi:hypothetical protein